MKKNYRDISEDIYRLVTRKGFIDFFWEELSRRRETNPSVTQEEVFEYLNERFKNEFGEYQFPSFDAFRKERDKRRRR